LPDLNFSGNLELDITDACRRPSNPGYAEYLRGVVQSAGGQPIAKENLKQSSFWLRQRGIEPICQVMDDSPQETALSIIVTQVLNRKKSTISVVLSPGCYIPANGTLLLIAIAKTYHVRFHIFSTQQKPKIIGSYQANLNMSLLHQIDSYTAISS
ncbi:hypothetical protein DFQ28_001474, partial [Apophysomyces sp. BC1034]